VLSRRFLAAHVALGVAALGLAAGSAFLLLGRGGSTRCSERIPGGDTIEAAWRTTELFVTDVILNRQPACGYALGTRKLRHGLPLKPFARDYPAVPIARASRDPGARQAVYILSRREAAFVVLGAAGRREIPMLVGLAAPHAGRGAYNLALVVEDGSWRVDRVRRVPIVER
jgi:hypothetical protein